MTHGVSRSKVFSLCLILSLVWGSAIRAEDLDVSAAWQRYQDEKSDADAAYSDLQVKKKTYDDARSDLGAAQQRLSNSQSNLGTSRSELNRIDRDINSQESSRTSQLNEIDRLAISIGNVDNQLTNEQGALTRLQRDRMGTQRRLEQVERRIQEAQRRPTGDDWTCNWVDKGKEEHRGGHPATHRDKEEANRLAKEECEKLHGTCVSRGCTQPENEEVKRLKREQDQLEQEIRDLDSKIQSNQNRIQSLENDRAGLVQRDLNCRTEIRNIDDRLSALNRDRDRTDRTIANQEVDVQQRQGDVTQAQNYVNRVKPAYDNAFALNDREQAQAKTAYAYYEQVQANYDAALGKVLTAAKRLATEHADKEAVERASLSADIAGQADGAAKGSGKAAGDIAGRDEALGYAEGRRADALIATFASDYQRGKDAGAKVADSKATAEEFPKGFNSALASMLANPPAQEVALDVTTDTTTETAGSGTFLVSGQMKVGAVAAPAPVEVVTPSLAPPSVPAVAVQIPAANKTFYAPQCEGLVLAEFKPKCLTQYENEFQTAFRARYDAAYKAKYGASYKAATEAAYQQGLKQQNANSLANGRKLGVEHRGILDGYASRLATAQQEQYGKGEGYLNDYLDKGALVFVRSASLQDTTGDGLLSAGEKASVDVVLDNYGKQSTKKGALQLKLQKVSGLKADTANEWLAIPPSSRVTLKKVQLAEVVSAVAGAALVAEGQVQRQDGAGSIGMVAAQGKVGFARQLESLVLEKKPKIEETVKAKLTFVNNTSLDLPETKVGLRVSPVIMGVGKGADALVIPALKPGEKTEVSTTVVGKNFVGENTDVPFWADVQDDGKTVSQSFPKRVEMDRPASLLLYDGRGQPVPNSTLTVQAGTRFNVGVQLKYNRTTQSAGEISIRTGQTSEAGLGIVVGTTTGTNYGYWTPSRQSTVQWFQYTVPATMKGKRGWVMINLSEGSQWLQLQTIYLDVQ